jgi:hypothetical protein
LPLLPHTDAIQHAPGLKIGKDAAPTFTAETHPPGTAPAESTFRPNPEKEIPGQALNPDASRPETEGLGRTAPLDSLPTYTSKDVHNAAYYGKPPQGQTAQDRKRGADGTPGLEGVGATMPGTGTAEEKVHALRADRD